jgi:hypothetical protein
LAIKYNKYQDSQGESGHFGSPTRPPLLVDVANHFTEVPLAHLLLPVGKGFDYDTRFSTVFPLALEDNALRICLFALAMHLAVPELSLVLYPVFPKEYPLATHLVMQPFPVIYLLAFPRILSLALKFVIDE